jgi:hypothetical protein
MFYHAQLLGRSKLGFSINASLASLCVPLHFPEGLLQHETARTRAACVSLSLFNNVKEHRKPFPAFTPEDRRPESAAWYKPLKLSLVSGDNKERSPTSGARSSVTGL